ncbi:MAG: hypothetical protein WC990_02205 [Sphaerochaetaceae bacterium]
MSRDFTLHKYEQLLNALTKAGYEFQTFRAFIESPKECVVVLRHDVDKLPQNALDMALIEQQLGINASYYFRVVKSVFKPDIVRDIEAMGNEIGYHYEDVDLENGNLEESYNSFKRHLAQFREVADIKTICMHGSPLSKYDNRLLWEKYSYKGLGLLAEPYFDVDYNQVLYITDTGRSWNNSDVSIRDKVNSKFDFKIKNTDDLIALINSGKLPNQIMINTHPQRWSDSWRIWTTELIIQNIKNQVKKILVR